MLIMGKIEIVSFFYVLILIKHWLFGNLDIDFWTASLSLQSVLALSMMWILRCTKAN